MFLIQTFSAFDLASLIAASEPSGSAQLQALELRELLSQAGLVDLELYASGRLVPNNEAKLPEVGSDAWEVLLKAEIEASKESSGAGTHILAWSRVTAAKSTLE